MSETATTFLYISITIISSVTAGLSQRRRKLADVGSDNTVRFSKGWFLLSFLILWFFYVFTDISNDYYHYVDYFNYFQWYHLFDGDQEPGYALINLIIKTFTSNYHIAMGVIKTLILLLVFDVFYALKDKIHLGIAVMAYCAMFYFSSFNLVSICLAAAICLVGIKYIIFNKNTKSLICFAVAFSVHYTAFFMVVGFIAYLFCIARRKGKINWLKFIIFLGVLVMILLSITIVHDYFVNNIQIFSKYARYSNIESQGTGIVQYLYYFPIFALIYYAILLCKDNRIIYSSLIFTVFGFFFALLGYSYEVISRAGVYFVMVHLIFVPYFIQQVKFKKLKPKHKIRKRRINPYPLDYNLTMLLIVVYYAMRFAININDVMIASGMSSYKFIWQ